MSLLRRMKFTLRKTKSFPNLQASTSYTNTETSTDALDTQSVIDANSSDEYTDTDVYTNADTDVYTNPDTDQYSNADTSTYIGKKRKRTRRGGSSTEAKALKGKKWRARKKARKLGLDVKDVYEEKGIKVASNAPADNFYTITEQERGPSIPRARVRSLAPEPAPSLASLASIAPEPAPAVKKTHRRSGKRIQTAGKKRIEKWRRKADIAARFDKALMQMRLAHQALVDQVLAEEALAEQAMTQRLEPHDEPQEEPAGTKQVPRRTRTVSDTEDHDGGAMSDWSISSSVNTVKTI